MSVWLSDTTSMLTLFSFCQNHVNTVANWDLLCLKKKSCLSFGSDFSSDSIKLIFKPWMSELNKKHQQRQIFKIVPALNCIIFCWENKWILKARHVFIRHVPGLKFIFYVELKWNQQLLKDKSKNSTFLAESGNFFKPSPMRLNAKQRAGGQESEKLEDKGITCQKKSCIIGCCLLEVKLVLFASVVLILAAQKLKYTK